MKAFFLSLVMVLFLTHSPVARSGEDWDLKKDPSALNCNVSLRIVLRVLLNQDRRTELNAFLNKYNSQEKYDLLGTESVGSKIENFRRGKRSVGWKELLKGENFQSEKEFWEACDRLEKSSAVVRGLNWLHGTSSSALALIHRTDNMLLPAGDLATHLERASAPFSGALDEGFLLEKGINNRFISGVSPAHSKIAKRYAYQAASAPFSWKTAISNLNGVIEFDANWSVRKKLAMVEIKRLRLWDEQRFQKEVAPVFAQSIKKLDTAQQAELLNFMASSKDSIQKNGIQPSEKPWITDPFPVVVAASVLGANIHGWSFPGSEVTESLTPTATLGKEVQTLFVPQDKVREVKTWLQDQGLEGRVSVLPVDVLDTIHFALRFRKGDGMAGAWGGELKDFTRTFDEFFQYVRDSRGTIRDSGH